MSDFFINIYKISMVCKRYPDSSHL